MELAGNLAGGFVAKNLYYCSKNTEWLYQKRGRYVANSHRSHKPLEAPPPPFGSKADNCW
jgi:hypothetical protein